MNKSEWLGTLQTERAQWDALVAEVGQARMTQPGAAGEWSVKDVIAHVTWFEREMVGVLRAHGVFDQLLAGMQSLTEEDLHDPLRFAEMPADWAPWQVIASNCYEHYRQHAPGFRDWMAQYAQEAPTCD